MLFVAILLGVVAQIALKAGMRSKGKVNISLRSFYKDIIQIYLNKFVFFGITMYALSFLLWVYALSKIDLSYAYPLVSVNFVLVTLLSRLVFKEKVSKLRWLSIAVIMIGVVLITLS